MLRVLGARLGVDQDQCPDPLGSEQRRAHRQKASLRHPCQHRLLDSQMVEQAEAVLGRVPVGERLSVELGVAEPALVPGDDPKLRRERVACGANISWSIKKPWEKIRRAVASVSSKRMR